MSGKDGKTLGAADLVKNREAISRLAQSSDAQRLLQLLRQGGEVQGAAQAAADGDPAELVKMMQQVMSSREGAELVERISRKAKGNGLT